MANFSLEDRTSKTIHVCIYVVLLLFIGGVYLVLTELSSAYGKFITVFISVVLGLSVIIYREKLVRVIHELFLSKKVRRAKKRNQKGLEKTIYNLRPKREKESKKRNYKEKVNKVKEKAKSLRQRRDKVYEIK